MGLLPQWRFKPEFSPITGFIGTNGAGKSAMAQHYALGLGERLGIPVFSNIELRREGVVTGQIRGLLDLITLPRCVLLWDDVSAVAPARMAMASPPEVVKELKALRHRDIVLAYTTPSWDDVDIDVRRVTQVVVGMRPLIRKTREGQSWPDTTWAYARAWSVVGENVTEIVKGETPVTHHGPVRLRDLRLDGYDTRAEIELMIDHGVCRHCGLKMRVEYCRCGHTSRAVPIASSTSRGDAGVKFPTGDQVTTAGAERVPGPEIVQGLDAEGAAASLGAQGGTEARR